jgi:monoterpene epsilon-lactone hydrolase
MANPQLLASEHADGFLNRSWLAKAATLYANGCRLEDPRLSPLSGSFEGFPAVHMNVGTRDMLLPDIRRVVEKLSEANVLVHYIEPPGGIHTYPVLLTTPEAIATSSSQIAWITGRLDSGGT